jgi:hypothetical protein
MHIPNDAERHRKWHAEAGRTALIAPAGDRAVVFDLDHPTGPAQIEMDSCNAGDAIERGKGRYVRALPTGMIPGPLVGANRLKM